MLNHQKIETMSPSGITVGYKVFLNVRMKPNDKETEYMKMKIINSYQKSCSGTRDHRYSIDFYCLREKRPRDPIAFKR